MHAHTQTHVRAHSFFPFPQPQEQAPEEGVLSFAEPIPVTAESVKNWAVVRLPFSKKNIK